MIDNAEDAWWEQEMMKEEEVAEREAASKRPFGWEVDVEFQLSSRQQPKTFHWRGCSKRTAKIKGLMLPNAAGVTDIRPVTEEQWIRTYGLGRM